MRGFPGRTSRMSAAQPDITLHHSIRPLPARFHAFLAAGAILHVPRRPGMPEAMPAEINATCLAGLLPGIGVAVAQWFAPVAEHVGVTATDVVAGLRVDSSVMRGIWCPRPQWRLPPCVPVHCTAAGCSAGERHRSKIWYFGVMALGTQD